MVLVDVLYVVTDKILDECVCRCSNKIEYCFLTTPFWWQPGDKAKRHDATFSSCKQARYEQELSCELACGVQREMTELSRRSADAPVV